MKNYLRILTVLFYTSLFASAALPPVVRNAWTTNLPGATISATNNVRLYPPSYNNLPLIVYDNAVIGSLIVNSNGNVGIGEINPLFVLDILDPTGQIRVSGTNSAGLVIRNWSAPANSRYISLYTADSRGTISSLDDAGGYNKEGIITWDNTNGNAWVLGQMSGLAGTNGSNFVTLTQLQNSNGVGTYVLMSNGSSTNQLLVNPTVGQSAYNAIPLKITNHVGTSVLLVNSNGNVGIGVLNPLSAVHVAGSIIASNNTADGDLNVSFVNDAKTWKAGVYGSSLDDFHIHDMTSGRIPIGVASVDGVVFTSYGLYSTNSKGTTVLGVLAGRPGTMTNGVAIGEQAGRDAGNAYNTTFVGTVSGTQVTNAYYTTAIGIYSAYQARDAYNSVFSGAQAGYISSGCYSSVIDGMFAGYFATNIFESVLIGYNAGWTAKTSQDSVFIGKDSGYTTVNAPWSVSVGQSAGRGYNNAGYAVSIGNFAGYNAAHITNTTSVGYQAGDQLNTAYGSVFIGSSAGYQAVNGNRVVVIGEDAAYAAYAIHGSVMIGKNAGNGSRNSSNSVFVGYQSGGTASGSAEAVFIGSNAGNLTTNATKSVMIGHEAGLRAVTAANCIFIGPFAGTNTARANTLLIDGAYKGTNALIYGEFNTPLIRFNGKIQTTNGTSVVTGLNTNINVIIAGSVTNQLQFVNGLLIGVLPFF